MPGDWWQQRATTRAYLGFMWAHPGKQLLFMGQEFAQGAGMVRNPHRLVAPGPRCPQPDHPRRAPDLVRDLNTVYRHEPALWQRDTDPAAHTWIAGDAADDNVLAFLRHDTDGTLLAVSHFCPVVRHDYRLGIPGRHPRLARSPQHRRRPLRRQRHPQPPPRPTTAACA